MKALLLIDLQNDFMPGGALAVSNGFLSIEAANIAQEYFKIIVASKDWHPPGHQSFASSHPGKKPGDSILLKGQNQHLWPDHCIQNTFGAALAKNLNQSQIRHVVTKGENIDVDSYSSFFDNAHRYETSLCNYLKAHHVSHLYILGVATEYCVKYSALDAVDLGFNTSVIIDGCLGIALSPYDIPKAREEMINKGVRLITLADLPKELS